MPDDRLSEEELIVRLDLAVTRQKQATNRLTRLVSDQRMATRDLQLAIAELRANHQKRSEGKKNDG